MADRVFLIETPTVNVERAREFGELNILFPREDPLKVSALDTGFYAGTVIERLEKQEFNPNQDILCLVGPVTSMCVVVAAMATRYKAVRCLLFNANKSCYELKTLGRWQYPTKWTGDKS